MTGSSKLPTSVQQENMVTIFISNLRIQTYFVPDIEIPFKKYTNPVVTLWYRAPELLVGLNSYSSAIDIWSMGCIFAELLNRGFPIMQGKSELHQLQLMCELIGYPTQEELQEFSSMGNKQILKELEKFQNFKGRNLHKILPQANKQAIELIYKMLQWDPKKRVTVTESLLHPYFYEAPRPSMPEEIKILKKLDSFRKKTFEQPEKKIKK